MASPAKVFIYILSLLSDLISVVVSVGKVLIFVLHKATCEELALLLRQWFTHRQLDIAVATLHGDKDQSERSKVMHQFCKTSNLPILIATDLAARGLDVQDVRTVINYDTPKNIETYVHRIGRTGRMGVQGVHPGTAYTLLTPRDSSFAVDLVHNLRLSEQPVSEELVQLAQKDPKWHKVSHNRVVKGATAGLGAGQRAMTSAMLAAAAAPPTHSHTSRPVIGQTSASMPSAKPAATTTTNAPGGSGGTMVRGFVRASTEYHSVSSAPAPAPASTAQSSTGTTQTNNSIERRKRSRWDT